eukprot:COSAG04_NODE_599_length_12233_cov_61.753750_6_plen_269_part_00
MAPPTQQTTPTPTAAAPAPRMATSPVEEFPPPQSHSEQPATPDKASFQPVAAPEVQQPTMSPPPEAAMLFPEQPQTTLPEVQPQPQPQPEPQPEPQPQPQQQPPPLVAAETVPESPHSQAIQINADTLAVAKAHAQAQMQAQMQAQIEERELAAAQRESAQEDAAETAAKEQAELAARQANAEARALAAEQKIAQMEQAAKAQSVEAAAEAKSPTARSEFAGLRTKELRALAVSAGVARDALEDALDEDDVKGAMVLMITEARRLQQE